MKQSPRYTPEEKGNNKKAMLTYKHEAELFFSANMAFWKTLSPNQQELIKAMLVQQKNLPPEEHNRYYINTLS